jgi:CRP/FNR family transcriptional regulator
MIENKKILFDCETCIFRNISCRYLSNDEFEVIRRTSSQLHFKKGENILKQGGKATQLIFLHKGIVKFNFQNDNEKNFIMTIVAGPKLLGGANLFFRETNLFSLVALEDCDVCLIDGRAFKNALVKHGNYMLTIFEHSVEMFQASIFNFISLAHKQVHGRIADILIYLTESVYKNTNYDLTLSRKEIAEFAACSHENVITTLSKLNKEGIIKLEGKKITIKDRIKLLEISKRG